METSEELSTSCPVHLVSTRFVRTNASQLWLFSLFALRFPYLLDPILSFIIVIFVGLCHLCLNASACSDGALLLFFCYSPLRLFTIERRAEQSTSGKINLPKTVHHFSCCWLFLTACYPHLVQWRLTYLELWNWIPRKHQVENKKSSSSRSEVCTTTCMETTGYYQSSFPSLPYESISRLWS